MRVRLAPAPVVRKLGNSPAKPAAIKVKPVSLAAPAAAAKAGADDWESF
jgi:hypothetical protein